MDLNNDTFLEPQEIHSWIHYLEQSKVIHDAHNDVSLEIFDFSMDFAYGEAFFRYSNLIKTETRKCPKKNMIEN